MDVIKRVSTAWRSITYEQTCYRLLDSDTQADSGAAGELIDIDSMTYVRNKPLQGSTLLMSSVFNITIIDIVFRHSGTHLPKQSKPRIFLSPSFHPRNQLRWS